MKDIHNRKVFGGHEWEERIQNSELRRRPFTPALSPEYRGERGRG